MTKGQVLCIKTTGEKVYLIAETDRRTWQVRRPIINDNGGIIHEIEEFFENEMETIEDFAKRLVGEMITKARAQKALLKAELAVTEEFEKEVAEAVGPQDEPIN